MEQVLEREGVTQNGCRVYHIYDDDGSEIRNPGMLKAIANAQEYIEIGRASCRERV